MPGLFPPPLALTQVPESERRVVRALRAWALMVRHRQCPLRTVAEQIGSLRAAAHLHLMLEEIGAAWPDRFAVSPLCCARLSLDEAVLVEMMKLAREGDRPGFDRLLAEMLPAEEREKLFLSTSVLGKVLARAD